MNIRFDPTLNIYFILLSEFRSIWVCKETKFSKCLTIIAFPKELPESPSASHTANLALYFHGSHLVYGSTRFMQGCRCITCPTVECLLACLVPQMTQHPYLQATLDLWHPVTLRSLASLDNDTNNWKVWPLKRIPWMLNKKSGKKTKQQNGCQNETPWASLPTLPHFLPLITTFPATFPSLNI